MQLSKATIQKLFFLFSSFCSVLLLAGILNNVSSSASPDFSVLTQTAGFCDEVVEICTIELTTRASLSDEILTLGEQQYNLAAEADLPLSLRVFERTTIQDDLSVFQPDEVHDIQQPDSETCLDSYQFFIHKLAGGPLTTDDGIFTEGQLQLDLYDCFIDGDERSDYLDSTSLFQIIE